MTFEEKGKENYFPLGQYRGGICTISVLYGYFPIDTFNGTDVVSVIIMFPVVCGCIRW